MLSTPTSPKSACIGYDAVPDQSHCELLYHTSLPNHAFTVTTLPEKYRLPVEYVGVKATQAMGFIFVTELLLNDHD